jgi:hypothetical protein
MGFYNPINWIASNNQKFILSQSCRPEVQVRSLGLKPRCARAAVPLEAQGEIPLLDFQLWQAFRFLDKWPHYPKVPSWSHYFLLCSGHISLCLTHRI